MIGIVDSGLGGLAVAREIWQLKPKAAMVYLADHAFFPYGNKTAGQINRRLRKIVDWFLSQNCQLIVIACNTITATAINQLRQQYTIPLVGTEPAVKQGGLVLVTPTTASSSRYKALAARFAVETVACPNLAPAIEKGEPIKPHLPKLPVRISKLVLGCTHYILVKDKIKAFYGSKVEIVDPSLSIARQALKLLPDPEVGSRHFFTTGDKNKASSRASLLLNQRIIFDKCSLTTKK